MGLEAGAIRDAAEKAWGATKRATDALILARKGELPETTAGTNPALETLVGRYFTRISYLHGSCFYNGMCGPDTDRRILQTSDYIEDDWFLAHSP